MVKITKNLRSTQFKHGLFFCEGNYNNMYLITQSDKLSKWKTQAKIKNNWNLRVLTLEINRDMSQEIWKTKNDDILNSKMWSVKTLSLQKRIPSGTWVIEKRSPDQQHTPWERWAVDSLIIMINYCIQGIELFQKLCIGLEYMVPNVMGKSS